jgi:hypothetical protein
MDLWLAIAIAAVVTIGSGFSLRSLHERKVRRHQAKIDDRLAAGKDRYFEELRELQAYDPRNIPPWRNVARELLILGIGAVSLVAFLISFDW